jgi:radical SAM-linked protein
MKYSEGFNPHPKLSFAMALAVGMTSTSEFFDVELEDHVAPEVLVEQINRFAPSGFEAKKAMITEEKLPSLTSMVEESGYVIEGKVLSDDAGKLLLQEVADILSKESILQRKRNKKGKYLDRDVRPLIRTLNAQLTGDTLKIQTLLATGSQENLRPEAVLILLDPEKSRFDWDEGVSIQRTFLGKLNGEELL